MWEETTDDRNNVKSIISCGHSTDETKWVDLFVQEMTNASDLDDARGRAARILEAFEQSISAQNRVSEEVV